MSREKKNWITWSAVAAFAVARRARRPLRAERAEGRSEEGRPGRRVRPGRRGAEDLRRARATSTSTTCSPRAGTRARSTSTAIPSMRHLSTIPVYTPYPATGYGFDDESKAMLGDLTWGDVHHPSLSETNGDYDGRWLFVNDMNGRVARVDLRDFKTKQIFGPMPERLRQPRLGLRHAEHRVLDDGLALLDPDPQGHRRAHRQVRDGLQGRHRRREDRPEDRRDDAGLADPDAALRLRPRRRRQEGLRRLDVLDLLQLRARHRQARGHGVPARPRLHRRRRLEGRREGHRRGQGRHDRRRQGPRSEEGPGHRLPAALRQVAARRRRLARRQVHHRLRQAPGRHDRLQLREDPDGDPQQGLHRATRTASRSSSTSRSRTPRSRSASGPLHTQFGPNGECLHLALRRQRHRQVEARHLGSRRQGPDVLLDRPPDGGRGRHCLARRASTSSASTSSRTAGTSRSGRRSPSPRSWSTSPKRR